MNDEMMQGGAIALITMIILGAMGIIFYNIGQQEIISECEDFGVFVSYDDRFTCSKEEK